MVSHPKSLISVKRVSSVDMLFHLNVDPPVRRQVIGWDRGRPRPQMSAKRELNFYTHMTKPRACGALRAGRPRFQPIT